MHTLPRRKQSATEPLLLGHPNELESHYAVASQTVTSLYATQAAVARQGVYGHVTPQSHTNLSPKLEHAQLISPMVAIPTPTESNNSSHQYVLAGNQENMEVAETLANLHKMETPSSPNLQNNRLIIISQNDDGEIKIRKNQNVSLDKGEEKLLKKIARTAAVRPLKFDKDAAYASLDSEISQYLLRYESEEATKKITMRDLRHVIPLLIMRCYAIGEEPYQRKVRGMWTEKPSNWPMEIPFCDPNNKKDAGKPKKGILLQMFMYLKKVYTLSHGHLVERYKFRRRTTVKTESVTPEAPPSPPLEAMETVTTSTETGGPSAAFIYPGGGRGDPAAFTTPRLVRDRESPSPPPAAVPPPPPRTRPPEPPPPSRPHTPPHVPAVHPGHVASFSELHHDWDPELESIDRIDDKMRRLDSYCILSATDKNMLYMIIDVINKMYQVRSQDHLFFLEIVHEFEASLDIIRLTGSFPEKIMRKWQEFYEKWFHEMVSLETISPEGKEHSQ